VAGYVYYPYTFLSYPMWTVFAILALVAAPLVWRA